MKGIKFQCQKTGRCCRTPSLFIPVTHRDLVYLYDELEDDFERLVDSLAFYSLRHLSEKKEAVYRKMVVPPIVTSKGLGFLALKKKTNSHRCVFLTRSNLCKVYKSRPLSCLLYPITFVEILKSRAKREFPCMVDEKEVCLDEVLDQKHVHAVFSKASLSSCIGIDKGYFFTLPKLIQMAQVFYRDLDEFRSVVNEINRLGNEGEPLSPREVISVLLAYGLKKTQDSGYIESSF